MSSNGNRPFPQGNEGLSSVESNINTPTCDTYEIRMSETQRIQTRKKQTSLFEYLPLAFQTRYDTKQDNPIDE